MYLSLEMKNLLIIANSGRMLAQFAANLNIQSLVIDCFSDMDTEKLALQCIRVESLALVQVKTAVFSLMANYSVSHVVYGSGLECYPATLEFLHQNLSVLGNTPDTFLTIQNKQQFFQVLTRLKIPYPETSFTLPHINKGWLIKPMQGEGGIGVKKYQGLTQKSENSYWQQYQSGTAMSVLFVANGIEFKIIGFNKQYVTSIADNDFVFLAVISQPEITHEIVNRITVWLTRLVVKFSLTGINSLDFIVDRVQCYALEINPRPSASMQLYHRSLLANHINGLNKGRLLAIAQLGDYQGYQIVFAENKTYISVNTLWPQWVIDIPQAGVFINTGLPICSIIASGKNEQQVQDLLLLKQQMIKKILR